MEYGVWKMGKGTMLWNMDDGRWEEDKMPDSRCRIPEIGNKRLEVRGIGEMEWWNIGVMGKRTRYRIPEIGKLE